MEQFERTGNILKVDFFASSSEGISRVERVASSSRNKNETLKEGPTRSRAETKGI